jgi:hypothetical protein
MLCTRENNSADELLVPQYVIDTEVGDIIS